MVEQAFLLVMDEFKLKRLSIDFYIKEVGNGFNAI